MLPEPDIEFLDEKGYEYELVPHPAGVYLIIKNFELGVAYQPNVATLLINVISGYPNSPLDMFWTFPDIKLINGNGPQAAEVHETYNETVWQRWSRHYQWRGGIDNVRTFITAIKQELAKGI